MTIAHSGQRPIFEAHTRERIWNGWRIILGVIVTIGMWMAFAGLCVTIVDDLTAHAVGDVMTVPQPLAQVALGEKAA